MTKTTRALPIYSAGLLTFLCVRVIGKYVRRRLFLLVLVVDLLRRPFLVSDTPTVTTDRPQTYRRLLVLELPHRISTHLVRRT